MKRKKIPPAARAGMVVCGAAVVCKALQRERRRKMKDMKLWEKRRKAQ